jgi:hypothetical protein
MPSLVTLVEEALSTPGPKVYWEILSCSWRGPSLAKRRDVTPATPGRLFTATNSGMASQGIPDSFAHQSDFARLAGGTIPFMRKYSTICP